MFTGIARHAGALGTAFVVLIGAAILHDGPAAADPNQDDRFLALLEKKEIPAVANVPRVIDAAHKVCRKLDGGMPVNDIVDGLRNDAYNIDPVMRLYPVRLTTTMTRFIAAAVEIYCPNHHSKMAFAMANFEPGSNEPTHRVAASTRSAVDSGSALRASASDMTIMSPGWRQPTGAMLASVLGAVRAGDPLIPNPPPIPVPPPAAQTLIPPPPIVAPPPPRPAPPQEPPPQEPPPPPPEVEPPAGVPQPGGAAGSGGAGGSGGNGGGGGPVEPSPARPMPPGFIRLAP
ncbi:DUF732 domain-containing protein [Mycobacterium canetti]|uniref:DUF732 domain-containing protein n=1 Tax=Mycobacterium canetti TaxID=78331 RepID=UPI0002A56841|nr:DUF732 domain-containing protein [Mycobacterium canetti]CCK65553.1 Conserved protein of unknown function, proline rich protein [Mycobacterium canettii CIPT 140070017]